MLSQKFSWMGEVVSIPDACFDEDWRFLQLTPDNEDICRSLHPRLVELFNLTVADSDAENDPIAVMKPEGGGWSLANNTLAFSAPF